MVKYCKWFKNITYADESLVGKKAAVLADLQKVNFPVPNGFVVTAEAYRDFVKARQLDKKIPEKLKTITNENLRHVSQEIQNLFLMSSLSAEMISEISEHYAYIDVAEELRDAPVSAFISSGRDSATVAIRSSAISSPFSHAVLNLNGSQNVTKGVLAFWASLFSPEAISYRNQNNISYVDIDLALIVQRQVNADKSGSAYLKDADTIALEAVWGMGKSFVVRNFDPTKILLNKHTGQVVNYYKNEQPWMLTKDLFNGKIVKKNIPAENKSSDIVTDKEFRVLSDLLIKVNEHLYHEQEVEWATEKNRVFLLQATQKKQIQVPLGNESSVIPHQGDVKPASQPEPEAPEEEHRPHPQEPTPVDRLEPYELLKFFE